VAVILRSGREEGSAPLVAGWVASVAVADGEDLDDGQTLAAVVVPMCRSEVESAEGQFENGLRRENAAAGIPDRQQDHGNFGAELTLDLASGDFRRRVHGQFDRDQNDVFGKPYTALNAQSHQHKSGRMAVMSFSVLAASRSSRCQPARTTGIRQGCK
jgi:multidrug resistance efflux pump